MSETIEPDVPFEGENENDDAETQGRSAENKPEGKQQNEKHMLKDTEKHML